MNDHFVIWHQQPVRSTQFLAFNVENRPAEHLYIIRNNNSKIWEQTQQRATTHNIR